MLNVKEGIMKRVLLLAVLAALLAGCAGENPETTILKMQSVEKIVELKNVERVVLIYNPGFHTIPAWHILVYANHPTCGEFRISEQGNDIDALIAKATEKLGCLNACK